MPVTLVNPYTTLPEVLANIRNLTAPQAVQDACATAINTASRYIDEYTQRDFLFHDFSVSPLIPRIEWTTRDVISLPWPVLTLTQITELGQVIDPKFYYANPGIQGALRGRIERVFNTDQLLAGLQMAYSENAEYAQNLEAITYNRTYNWEEMARRGQLAITGTFGYQVPDQTAPPVGIPSGVRHACTLIAAAWSGYNTRERIGFDGQKQSLLDDRIPQEAATLLKRYKSVPL